MFLYVIADDECFYVGLGHQGQSARKGNNFVPDNYRPFQCCPSKVEKSTRVPKMSARKIGHNKDTNDKSHFEFSPSTHGNIKAKKTTASTKSKSEPTQRASTSSTIKKSQPKKVNRKNGDNDDVPVVKEAKKPASKSSIKEKESNKAKPGQKGLLGIAKIVNWF